MQFVSVWGVLELIKKLQRISQTISTIFFNAYFQGFFTGGIYQGNLKHLCNPGLNCYSCPSALLSCPIGALQYMTAYGTYHFSFYIVGFLGIIGSIGGRIVCGWACPLGLLQDLLYRINLPKRKIPKIMEYGKYLVLIFLVFIVPYLTLEPWFTKLCPLGTLESGIPHLILNPAYWKSLGWLFLLKLIILVFFLFWMMIASRPFCRTTCPLGAIYSLFNSISYYRLRWDEKKCKKCNLCLHECPLSLSLDDIINNSRECVRCLHCLNCPEGALNFQKS